MFLRSAATIACSLALATAAFAPAAYGQMGDMPGMKTDSAKPLPSPPARAAVMLGGKPVTIDYNSPHMRGRTIMGELVPYDQVWRAGANPATTLKTAVNLKIGTLDVPAGTYTLFALPSHDHWMLIVSKKTGEWGIPYPEGFDLGRTPMMGMTLDTPQEAMSISFEKTAGAATELHIRWEKTDEMVTVKAQ